MLLSHVKFIAVIAISGLFLIVSQPKANAQDTELGPDVAPASCHVTLPSAGQFHPSLEIMNASADHYSHARGDFLYGNAQLSTVLPTDGIWRTVFSEPTHSAYRTELPWFRLGQPFSKYDGPLAITLTKLDTGQNQRATTYHGNVSPRDGAKEVKSNIGLPIGGCWQITGKYKDQELKFTVWVSNKGDRNLPAWSF